MSSAILRYSEAAQATAPGLFEVCEIALTGVDSEQNVVVAVAAANSYLISGYMVRAVRAENKMSEDSGLA
jgi:hypothetical protein